MAAKKPISRFSFTLADPRGEDCAVTAQVVVVAQDLEATAQVAEIPELAEAGWINQTYGALDIYIRIIGY